MLPMINRLFNTPLTRACYLVWLFMALIHVPSHSMSSQTVTSEIIAQY